MSRYRWFLPLSLAVLLLLVGGRALAQEGASLSIDPASQTVGLENGAFEVRVLVDDVVTPEGLGGYTLVMSYNPDVVHAVSVSDSGFVASTENAVVCPASGIDNDAGQLALLCFTIPIFSQPGPQTSEPRVLATIRFTPIAEGTSILDISGTTITDPQGNGLLATTSNGEVTVEQGSVDVSPAPNETLPTPDVGAGDLAPPASGGGVERRSAHVAASIALGVAGFGMIVLVIATLAVYRGRVRGSP